MSLSQLNEIYELLMGEPTPDDEINAQKKLITILEDLIKIGDPKLDINLLKETYEIVKNWDTLENWFSEVPKLPDNLKKIVEMAGLKKEEKVTKKSEEPSKIQQEKLESKKSDLNLSEIQKKQLYLEINKAIEDATKGLPLEFDKTNLVNAITEKITKTFLEREFKIDLGSKEASEKVDLEMKKIGSVQQPTPVSESKSKTIPPKLSPDKVIQDMMTQITKIESDTKKSTLTKTTSKLETPKIEIPKTITPIKKITPKSVSTPIKIDVKDESKEQQVESKDIEKQPVISSEKEITNQKTTDSQIPQPKKVSIPTPKMIKIPSDTKTPMTTISKVEQIPPMPKIKVVKVNQQVSSSNQNVNQIKSDEIKTIEPVTSENIQTIENKGQKTTIQSIKIKPVTKELPSKNIVEDKPSSANVQQTQNLTDQSKSITPEPIKLKPISVTPKTTKEPFVTEIKSSSNGAPTKIPVIEPVKIPVESSKEKLFHSLKGEKIESSPPPKEVKVGGLKAVNIGGGDIEGFAGVSKVTEAPTEDFEYMEPGDIYANMNKDELYQELIALQGKKFAIEQRRKDMRQKHEKGMINDIEYKTAIERLRYEIDNVSQKINTIRKKLQIV